MHQHTAHSSTASRVMHSARSYDLIDRVVPFIRRVRTKLVELAAPAPDEDVLDVGCGPGTLAIALATDIKPRRVCGIDPSSEMIARAKQKATKAQVAVDFQVASIEELPFPDASFDLVTSSLMLHHLPHDVKRRGLAQVRRVLRPGGRFMAVDLATPGHTPLGHLLSMFGHARGESTVAELTPMLKDAGFTDVEAIPTRHTNFAFIRAK
jgi:ubiquinone/menaquinone biosynthesis C-methylase UbiE